MRALTLDYHAKARKFPLGGVVLVAGALSAAFMFQEYRTLEQELSTWEAKVTEIRKSAKRGATGAPAKPRELEATALEVKAARAAIQRLLLPWDTLFSALESVRTTDVALLAIEADPDKRTVKLTAEAKSDTDMLNYVEQLQAANGLADVALASHQAKQDDPLKPLRFVVVASWMM
jgi:hypothetical protein